jgi:hypothetical protein
MVDRSATGKRRVPSVAASSLLSHGARDIRLRAVVANARRFYEGNRPGTALSQVDHLYRSSELSWALGERRGRA